MAEVEDKKYFEVGDHVRVVGLFSDGKKPVGVVKSINGGYIYVHTPMSDETEDDKCVCETYVHELIHITEQEYFKLLLAGANIASVPGKIKI